MDKSVYDQIGGVLTFGDVDSDGNDDLLIGIPDSSQDDDMDGTIDRALVGEVVTVSGTPGRGTETA